MKGGFDCAAAEMLHAFGPEAAPRRKHKRPCRRIVGMAFWMSAGSFFGFMKVSLQDDEGLGRQDQEVPVELAAADPKEGLPLPCRQVQLCAAG